MFTVCIYIYIIGVYSIFYIGIRNWKYIYKPFMEKIIYQNQNFI